MWTAIGIALQVFFGGMWNRIFPPKTAADQKADDLEAQNTVLKAELKAGAQPVSNDKMKDLLQEGKLCAIFLLALLASCASGVGQPVCLPLRQWDDVSQMNAKADLETLPLSSPLWGMMEDYARMRAQERACEGN